MNARKTAATAISGLIFASAGIAFGQGSDDNAATPTFGTTTVIPSGLRGVVYAINEGATLLPDFEKLKPLGYLYTNRLNIPSRLFSAGFPGITGQAEWFAIDYRGRFWIKNPGKYNFALTSDDGARLYIDDKLVIDNDGLHAAKTLTGSVTLTPRLHSIRLTYFQGPKYELALVLAVSPPKGKWAIFDMTDYVPGDEQLTPEEASGLNKQDREELLRTQAQEASSADEKAALKLFGGSDLPHDFDFRTAVFGFRDRNMLAFELPVSSLKATFEPATKNRRFNFYVFAVVKDADGHILQKFSSDSPYRVPEEKIAAFRATSFTFTRPFKLPPGTYTLQTEVIDRESKSVSASSVSIDRSGDAAIALGLSTPILIQKVQPVQGKADADDLFVVGGNRLVPQLAKNVAADAKPQVYFVVYPDKANPAAPAIKITFFVNGKQMAERTANLPPPDATGTIPLTIAASAQPGECELRITAMQGAESVSRTLSYTVSAP